MATTVTDDFVIGDAHEAETNMVEVTTAALSSIATDTIAAEGTNSVSYRVGGAALDGSSVNLGSGTNVRDAHIFQWVFTMQTFSNISAGGVRMRISSATDSNTNYGEWVVGGQDTSIGNNKNFQRWCVDTGQPYSATNGTVPATSR